MGGRGASSGGRSGRAPRGYRTVGKYHGIPIIKSHLPKGKILPTEAKPDSRYLGMNKRGEIKQLRVYDKQGKVKMDIDWQHPFQGHRDGTVHRHIWVGGKRSLLHSPLTKSEILRYKKAIEKATGRKDLIWEWK